MSESPFGFRNVLYETREKETGGDEGVGGVSDPRWWDRWNDEEPFRSVEDVRILPTILLPQRLPSRLLGVDLS